MSFMTEWIILFWYYYLMPQLIKQKIKVPRPGERTFIVREKKENHRKLWLDRTFIADIHLSSSVFSNITEDLWKSILSAYVVDGKPCDNYVVERNFESLDEAWTYLVEGGRITNLDDSCSCYVRLDKNELIFDNGELLERDALLEHPTSWVPFYPTSKMLKREQNNLIRYRLNLSPPILD
jgi:hypothetical protein